MRVGASWPPAPRKPPRDVLSHAGGTVHALEQSLGVEHIYNA